MILFIAGKDFRRSGKEIFIKKDFFCVSTPSRSEYRAFILRCYALEKDTLRQSICFCTKPGVGMPCAGSGENSEVDVNARQSFS